MNAEMIKREGNQVVLQLTIDAAVFEKGVQKAYLKERGRYNLPGFRKGKAPQALIEKNFGEGVFFEEAINVVVPEPYGAALDQFSLEPVDRPDLDIIEIGKGKDLVVTATVTVKPEVKLGAYTGIEVEKVSYEVTDEHVQSELDRSLDMNARMVTVEDRAVMDGDTLTIDYKGFVGEHQFEGGTAENQTLVIGSGRFIPGFEEQLVGASLGEDVTVSVTFPEEYHADELAGKEAKFQVKVNGIKAKEVPALDDEFAKDTSEFETLEELKADIRKRLEETNGKKAENEQRDKVVTALVDRTEIDVPQVMVESEINDMLRDFDYQLRYQGLDLEKYLQFSGSTIQDLRGQMQEDGLRRVKTSLTIEAVCKAEGITVSDEEVEAELTKLAEAQKTTVDKLRKSFARDNYAYLKDVILSRKTVDFLTEKAVIK